MGAHYPSDWCWTRESRPRALCEFDKAPEAIGIYELGNVTNGKFEPMYVGRAMRVSLRTRLGQHYRSSHNSNIRANRSRLFFRYKLFPTEDLTAYVEAVLIAALDYPWNKRNEWAQHFRLES